jgi:choline dehydrogenase-like flavoprotein
MGTACMGDDPNKSVVNRYCQVHGVNNLFIVDSSVFVTSGAVNPVATAQALTLWSCEFISSHWNEILS